MDPSTESLVGFLGRLPISFWPLLVLAAVILLQKAQFTKHTLIPQIPVVGQKWALEPLFITRFRFVMNGWAITREGLEKVR